VGLSIVEDMAEGVSIRIPRDSWYDSSSAKGKALLSNGDGIRSGWFQGNSSGGVTLYVVIDNLGFIDEFEAYGSPVALTGSIIRR
jgi:hypothetical protein